MNTKFTRSLVSGLAATLAMTMLMLVAPMMGMPKMPVGKMLAGFMHLPVAIGWIMHFMIGIILAGGYIFFFAGILKGSTWLKGLSFSLIPFLMAQLIVMPMMGAGFFSSATPAPMAMVMGSLMGHLVYGAVLGLTAGEIDHSHQHAVA